MDPLSITAQDDWTQLVRMCWIVLIPVGVLLVMILYKLVMLLHSVSEFFTLARYEMMPAMKDMRLAAENMELLSRSAVNSVKTIENGMAAAGPAVTSVKRRIVNGFCSFVGGLRKAFHRK